VQKQSNNAVLYCSWCGSLDGRGEAGAISEIQTSFSASPTPAVRDAQFLGEKALGGSFTSRGQEGDARAQQRYGEAGGGAQHKMHVLLII
jgi:hypothetical protein